MRTMTEQPDAQDILASLRRWQLEQDNSGPFRVYRDQEGQIYHSVTHILKHTAPQSQKDALERWSKRPGSSLERDLACDRGTVAHEHCEYVLKTAAKLARQSANKKGAWKVWDDGLARPPKAITTWALKKSEKGAPKVSWAAREYARGLSDWLVSGAVTAIHASEFSVSHSSGFAGTADALLDTELGLTICDFKTSSRETDKPEAWLKDHQDQLGAYSLALYERAGIRVGGGAVIIGKSNGTIQLRMLSELEMRGCEVRWQERMDRYMAMVAVGAVG
jgi:hypothetical protein